jgi:hypothetical protein
MAGGIALFLVTLIGATAGFDGLKKYADKMIFKQKPLQWLNHRKGFLFTVHCSLNTGSIRTATP